MFLRDRFRGGDKEVKTLAVGAVAEPALGKGEWEAQARDLSYFSRLAEHQEFSEQALVEIHRRGVEKAGEVCAVVDGAEWQQKFIDLRRPDAVRLLDFGHAAGYVRQAVYGSGTEATMVALRTIVCSDRWEEAWPQTAQQLRDQARKRGVQRRAERALAQPAEENFAPASDVGPVQAAPEGVGTGEAASTLGPVGNKPQKGAKRPAPGHPWRRMPVGRARLSPTPAMSSAKI